MPSAPSTRQLDLTPAPFGRKEAACAVAAAGLFAIWAFVWDRLGLLHAGPIAYANHEACDAWYYFGLSVQPKAGLLTSPDSRTLSRSMYFGAVHGAQSLLPWLGASVTSYFLFLPTTLAALYIALRAWFARPTAALACLLIATAPLFLNMMSTTYVSVGALAYSVCMLACLMWAPRVRSGSPNRAWGLFAAAGVFFACSANAQILSVEFNVFFCLLALLGQLSPPIRPSVIAAHLFKAAGVFLLGFAAGTLGAMLVADMLGLGAGSPFFQLRDALNGVGDWRYPGWHRESLGLALILLIAVLAVASLRQGRLSSKPPAADRLLIVAVAAAVCLFNLWSTLFMADQGLVFDFYYLLLLPSAALAFSAAFDGDLATRPRWELTRLFGGVIVAVLSINALLALSDGAKDILFWRPLAGTYGPLAVFAVLLVLGRASRQASMGMTIVCVAIFLQTAAAQSLRTMYFHARAPMQERTEMAEAALRFIFAHLDDAPALWVSKTADYRLPLPIVSSLHRCQDFRAFPDALPGAQDLQPGLVAGQTVIVLDETRNADQIGAAWQQRGWRLELVAARFFPLTATEGLQIAIGRIQKR